MLGEIQIIGITLVAAVIAAVAQYTFKRSVPKFSLSLSGIMELLKQKGIWLGLALYFGSLVVYLKALDSGQLSFVYPTFASSFIFIALISHVKLKEKLSAKRISGICLIVIGIVLVAMTYA